jgi:hypothetical protein
MIVYLVARGYYYYCIAYLPEKKKDRWGKTDIKLIEKYKTDKSKWQRSRLKRKGTANFYYLRWDCIAIILHTQGEISDTLNYDDEFIDIRKKQMPVKISGLTELVVWVEKNKENKKNTYRVSVKLGSTSYANLKAKMYEAAMTKDKAFMKKEFNKINGLPAWSGIIEQKKTLAKYLCNQAHKNQVALGQKELRLITKRFPVKAFEDNGKSFQDTAY